MAAQNDLIERRKRSIPRGLFHISNHAIAEGSGARFSDLDGKQFIDFASGVGVLNVGHTPPHVVEAIRDQAGKYLHGCFNLLMYEPYVALAERLNSIIPVPSPAKTFFLNSGAEAVENAVKLARHYSGRTELITFHYAYHGRTALATTMTGRVRSYRTGFGPGAPSVHRAPYPYCYRCPFGSSPDVCDLACFTALKELFIHTVPVKDVAAVVMEPVLGEGGVVVPPESYMKNLAEFCRTSDITLIMDEIQSGIGRTGFWTASEHFGIEPDVLLTAKALASGLPIGAVTGRAEIVDSPPPGGIGGTFCGNPLSCAAALATLEIIEQQNLLVRARELGVKIMKMLESWQDEFEAIGDVRGLGAWAALELVKDRRTREPDGKLTTKLIRKCHEKGLMTLLAGPYSNVVRLLPPLVISDEELDQGFSLLHEALSEVLGQSS